MAILLLCLTWQQCHHMSELNCVFSRALSAVLGCFGFIPSRVFASLRRVNDHISKLQDELIRCWLNEYAWLAGSAWLPGSDPSECLALPGGLSLPGCLALAGSTWLRSAWLWVGSET